MLSEYACKVLLCVLSLYALKNICNTLTVDEDDPITILEEFETATIFPELLLAAIWLGVTTLTNWIYNEIVAVSSYKIHNLYFLVLTLFPASCNCWWLPSLWAPTAGRIPAAKAWAVVSRIYCAGAPLPWRTMIKMFIENLFTYIFVFNSIYLALMQSSQE